MHCTCTHPGVTETRSPLPQPSPSRDLYPQTASELVCRCESSVELGEHSVSNNSQRQMSTSSSIAIFLNLDSVTQTLIDSYAAVLSAALRVLPVRLSVCPIRANNSKIKIKKRRQSKLVYIKVLQGTSKWTANFQFKRSKAKVIARQKPT